MIPLYSLCVAGMTVERIVALLETHEIRCCVDIRGERAKTACDAVDLTTLRDALRRAGIIYMSFEQEFSNLNASFYMGNGKIIYKKALESDEIRRGLQRLDHGLESNYRICIIDDNLPGFGSVPVGIIGRYYADSSREMQFVDQVGQAQGYTSLFRELSGFSDAKPSSGSADFSVGDIGEAIACDYLSEHGFRIAALNWNLHKGCEIDIVAYKDDKLHFVEVKTRTRSMTVPEYAVDREKMLNMRKAARMYIFENHMQRVPYQMDCVAIVLRTESDYDLRFIEDIHIESRMFRS